MGDMHPEFVAYIPTDPSIVEMKVGYVIDRRVLSRSVTYSTFLKLKEGDWELVEKLYQHFISPNELTLVVPRTIFMSGKLEHPGDNLRSSCKFAASKLGVVYDVSQYGRDFSYIGFSGELTEITDAMKSSIIDEVPETSLHGRREHNYMTLTAVSKKEKQEISQHPSFSSVKAHRIFVGTIGTDEQVTSFTKTLDSAFDEYFRKKSDRKNS